MLFNKDTFYPDVEVKPTYFHDGDERNEAQELDISGEAKTARSLRTPEPPTYAARMAHNATHVPFRDWCPICIASRGRSFSAQTSCSEQDSGYTN